jgi:hypothetical protein
MQQYTGEEFLNGFGSGGELNPGKIAQEIYGDKFDYGHATAYLLRRFGFSFEGYDDYKTLASWVLTTPLNGVYLWVMIKGNSSASCSFGVRFSKEKYQELHRLRCMPFLIKNADAQRLARENGYPFAVPKGKWNRRDKHALRLWEKKHGLLDKKKEDFSKEELDKIYNNLFDEMECLRKRAYDDLDKCGWINPASERMDLFNTAIDTAIRQALKELLKPVHVRDCYINILGPCKSPCYECKIPEEHCNGTEACADKFAEPHKYAGYGVAEFVKAYEKENK